MDILHKQFQHHALFPLSLKIVNEIKTGVDVAEESKSTFWC